MADSWRNTEEDLRTAQTEIRAWNLQRLGSDIEPIEESLAMLNDLMPQVFAQASSSKWHEHGAAMAMLFGWTLGRLVNAYRLLLEGYLSDAAVLLRAAWEAKWQLIAFDIEASQVSPKASSNIAKWISGKFVAPKDVRKMLADPIELAAGYKVLSKLSHPGHIRAVGLQIEQTGSGRKKVIRLHLAGHTHPELTDVLFNSLWGEVLDLLGYVPLAFPKAVGAPGAFAEWRARMLDRQRDFEDRRLPNPPTVAL